MPDDQEQQPEQQPEQESYGEVGAPIQPGGPVPFPWMMFFVAAGFDITEFFIPILMPSFGIIMGIWQKNYAPKTNPLMSFFLSKILDIATLGFLPSSIAIVVFAYIKKRAAAKQKKTIKLPKPSPQTA